MLADHAITMEVVAASSVILLHNAAPCGGRRFSQGLAADSGNS
jgi:hypothetical protein